MKLIEQILSELGFDGGQSVCFIPRKCCYLKGVKDIPDLSPSRITLNVGRITLCVSGENLSVGSYFQGDALIVGEVTALEVL